MTRDDMDFAKKIATYLDSAAAELKPGTAYRLQVARREALARLADPARIAGMELAGAAGNGGRTGTLGGGRGLWTSGRLWVGIMLIVAAVAGYHQWHAYQQLDELEETDAALLSSDLPIDAYLDRGFQNWLHTVNDD
jgi:hypothetical protein